MDRAAMKTQLERLSEKVKSMENHRKWNHPANEKQYMHQIRVRQLCVEDVRKCLVDYFGSRKEVPERIKEPIKIGEKEVNERIKMLRMADKVSWSDVDEHVTDPLCDNDEDDKRWKVAVKEAKEEQSKKKSSSSSYFIRNRGR